jgi:hypothetical protein
MTATKTPDLLPQGGEVPEIPNGHKVPAGHEVRSKQILGGLHHEYRLEKVAA